MKNKGHPNVDICAYIRETVGVRGDLIPLLTLYMASDLAGKSRDSENHWSAQRIVQIDN